MSATWLRSLFLLMVLRVGRYLRSRGVAVTDTPWKAVAAVAADTVEEALARC